jgi:5,6,7,8-tetrahydromethanopterin hydro-lyase
MAADFFLGESLVGDGNEIAHIDLIIGSKTGPAGTAFCNALANNKDGFTTLLAVVTPNLPAKPDTLLFNKVTIKGAKQAVQMFGPAQAAVARAVVDSVESGVIPQSKADDLCVLVGVFIHWEASDDKKIYDFNYDPARAGQQAECERSARRRQDGQAPVQPEVACQLPNSQLPTRNPPTFPFGTDIGSWELGFGSC